MNSASYARSVVGNIFPRLFTMLMIWTFHGLFSAFAVSKSLLGSEAMLTFRNLQPSFRANPMLALATYWALDRFYPFHGTTQPLAVHRVKTASRPQSWEDSESHPVRSYVATVYYVKIAIAATAFSLVRNIQPIGGISSSPHAKRLHLLGNVAPKENKI